MLSGPPRGLCSVLRSLLSDIEELVALPTQSCPLSDLSNCRCGTVHRWYYCVSMQYQVVRSGSVKAGRLDIGEQTQQHTHLMLAVATYITLSLHLLIQLRSLCMHGYQCSKSCKISSIGSGKINRKSSPPWKFHGLVNLLCSFRS